ncbi:MAG: hypothetical protein ISS57_07575 [Anaerolineales bacterium]|nr:hypothetical protein [Anaerolineales bacterium]
MNAKTLTGMTLEEVAVRLDEQLPQDAYKPVPGGADLTDIDPNYMRKVLNDIFGVCGYGWGYDYDASTIRSRTDVRTNRNGKEYTVIIVTLSFLEFWYKLVSDDQVHLCNVPATGSSENSNDAYAMKGALTNAIGNAVSNIGFQQSVYLGKRDHRTVKRTAGASRKGKPTRRKAAPKAKAKAKAAASSKSESQKTKAAAPAPDNSNSDPGDFMMPFGSGIKGKKLRELAPDKLDWVANKMAPFNDAGKAVQQKARQFQESLEAVA